MNISEITWMGFVIAKEIQSKRENYWTKKECGKLREIKIESNFVNIFGHFFLKSITANT